jgi:hypothetical protein
MLSDTMTKRTLVTMLAWVFCLGTVLGVLLQRQELVGLRAQQGPVTSAAAHATATPSSMVDNDEWAPGTVARAESVSHELLRMRSEVTRLNARKRELATAPEQAERLRALSVRDATNSTAGIRLPPGYMRKGEAQLVGYSTPEDTLQSFLWALQHHDIPNLLQALSPDEHLSKTLAAPGELEKGFFKAIDAFPGLVVQSRQQLPDGSVEMQVEIGPGVPSQQFHFIQINGEWKLEGGF